MSSTFSIHMRHGGFLTPPPDSRNSGDSIDYFDNAEYDKIGFFYIEGFVKKLLSNNPFSAIWYSKSSFSTFEQSLEILTNDFGAMEMKMMIARNNNNIVSIYVEHLLDDDVVGSEQDEGAVDGVRDSEDSGNDSAIGISFDDSDSDSSSSEEFEGTTATRVKKEDEDQSTDGT
ncbi:uncharacterized protein A4U43_C01F27200 [Asparagus officinalis]|uniref:PB1-like domain-containing protein n=1 Tax=Asparagus officinalis TaxID=4686 RepID=A0A5P1FSR8_ASPOF|nr:uncharacterized protein LOC109828940 [Asparagus officinalis]ONK81268.1 uncharacterized protein A4U43_C01F27200 [Asparagus officinalis]